MSSHALTEGPVARILLLFALPILGGNVLQSLNGSVNSIWVGRFLGEQALTATVNANNILFFLISTVSGLAMAVSIMVAQAVGRGEIATAKRVIGAGATFFVAMSLAIAALGLPFARHMLEWMATPVEALPYAEAYLKIIFAAVPSIYLFTFLTAILRGFGDTRTPLLFLLLVVVMDIAFNPILLFGIGPFPEIGIAGAAVATLVANGLGLAAILGWLKHRQHPLWIGCHDRDLYRADWAILRTLVVKGAPMSLQMVLISAAMIAMISMVNDYGVETAAAYGAVLQLWTYVQMPAMAIGAACSSMTAQNVGAGHWHRVEATTRTGVAFNFAMTGALIALLVLFDHATLSLFMPADSPSLEIARRLNHIAIGSFLFFGVTFVLAGIVRATGAVVPPLVILAIALWGIRIPFANILQPHIGVDAIWWSFPVSSISVMLMSLAYYRWGQWRRARIFPEK